MNQYEAFINQFRGKLNFLNKKPFVNRREIKKIKSQIQAFEEGGKDVMSTYITAVTASTGVVDKNNYRTYPAMVNAAYNMFESRSEYGSEIFRGVVETRIALVGGEGLSVIAKNEKTQDWIDSFLKINKLAGSRLLNHIQTGELEGRDLLLLNLGKYNGKPYVAVSNFSWFKNNYSVEKIDTYDGIKEIKYKKVDKDGNTKEVSLPLDRTIYVQIGGTDMYPNEPVGRIHCILTDCENFSRAKYDLRKNGFLFGRVTPTWKMDYQDPGSSAESAAIKNALNSFEWEPGAGYAGTAEFNYKTPGSGAHDLLLSDMLTSLRNIATTTGIPIHFLSHPELMSNRATAENLLEMVNLSTKRDRLCWEESWTETIEKAMNYAVDSGMETSEILGEFEVKLPLISLATLKNLIEVWFPLVGDVVSMGTFRNMLPGIDPSQEKKNIEAEKKEAVKKAQENPLFQNNTMTKINGGDNGAERNNNANPAVNTGTR